MSEQKVNKYHVITCSFPNWNDLITTSTGIPCEKHPNYIPKTPNHYIIPLDLRDRQLFQADKRLIFKMDINNVILLNNKCLFAKYMMENYPINIPRTISILTDQIDYYETIEHSIDKNVINKDPKMIKKGAIGCAGNCVTIIRELDKNTREKDFVISEYIDHTESYSGHFLVHKGIILKHIIFLGMNPQINGYIKRGPVKKYTTINMDQLNKTTGADVSIFANIFKQLNYSGFACPEFIVRDQIIKIFEINPRPGGSLIADKHYCAEFFNVIIKMGIAD